MSRQIWKFPIPLNLFEQSMPKRLPFRLDMPGGAHVVHVGQQNNLPALWAFVDTEAPKVQTPFVLVATGEKLQPHDGQATYLGTIVFHGTERVAHVFIGE